VPIILKSGSLTLLKRSGSVKACNGIALPLPLPIFHFYKVSKLHFRRRTSGLAERQVNCVDSEMYLPAKFVLENFFLKSGVSLKLEGALNYK
jgi:hypothetical protein